MSMGFGYVVEEYASHLLVGWFHGNFSSDTVGYLNMVPMSEMGRWHFELPSVCMKTSGQGKPAVEV